MLAERDLESITTLMGRFRAGDRAAADGLFTRLYPELKRLAAAKMASENTEHSWQPSVLVNELYLQLLKVKALPQPEARSGDSEREHFLRFAGHVMRNLLIDHSRAPAKRYHKIDIASFPLLDEQPGQVTLKEIDDLLEQLASINPRLRSIVELKVFEGMQVAEISERLGIAERTVARNWVFCKQWLRDQISPQEPVKTSPPSK
jgi:RNA polymerase sigma factor (TIGR02999 family)